MRDSEETPDLNPGLGQVLLAAVVVLVILVLLLG